MNLLILGDVFGQPGREAVTSHLSVLRRDLQIDVAIVNAENAAHGFGLTEKIAGELYEAGADILTTGNHVWDQRELIPYIERDPRVLRPANFPPGTPGSGTRLHQLGDGRSVLVVNLMGRLFMDPLDDPFRGLDAAIEGHALGRDVTAIVVDFHGEATSE
ncbi:MAG TPA: TIGR00282 family metallophosphoesterase, partial [Stellaceae bacterium]|nr:TIGR00282 family metallophosphoesterase [Stellaceae bacterium]